MTSITNNIESKSIIANHSLDSQKKIQKSTILNSENTNKEIISKNIGKANNIIKRKKNKTKISNKKDKIKKSESNDQMAIEDNNQKVLEDNDQKVLEDNNQKVLEDNNNNNLNSQEEKICRICYENDSKEKLYCPCKCDGTIKWIHKSCLDKWKDISGKNYCSQCNYKYVYKKEYKYLIYKYLDNKIFPKILTFLFLILSIITTGLISKFLLKLVNPNKYGLRFRFNLSFFIFSTRYFSILFFISLPILSYFKLIDLNRIYNEYINLNNGNPMNTTNTSELAIFVYYFFYGKIKNCIDNLIKSKYILENYNKDN